MDGVNSVAWYNLAIGLVVVLELSYLLYFESTETAYRPFVMVTVGGLALSTTGGPVAELIAPSFVHLVHAVAGLLVVFGLYDPVSNDLRTVEWSRVLLREPVQIRHPADWMTPMDDEILGMFYDANLTLSPSVIAFNTGYSKKEVNRRLIELEEHGLVERVERGKYQLTRFGERYLLGHLPDDSTADDETGVPR